MPENQNNIPDQSSRHSPTLSESFVQSTNVAIIFTDSEGMITGWNKGAETLFGVLKADVIDSDIKNFIDEQLHGNIEKNLQRISEKKYVKQFDCRVKNVSGIMDTVINMSPISDVREHIIGISWICRKPLELAIKSKALDESERKYNELLRDISDLVCELDSHFKIIFISDQYEYILGYQPQELYGKHFSKLITEEDQPDLITIFNTLKSKDSSYKTILRIKHKQNGYRWFKNSFRIIKHHDAANSYAVISHDITEIKNAEEIHRISEERLKLALEAGKDGHWDWNIRENTIFLSDTCYEILGYKPNDFEQTYQKWISLIHPEERNEFLLTAQTKAIPDKPNFSLELRFMNKSGDWIWIHLKGMCTLWQENDYPVRIVGTITDINKQKMTEIELRKSEERLDMAMKGAALGLWDFYPQTGYVLYNEGWANILGYTIDEVEQHIDFFKIHLHKEDYDATLHSLNNHIAGYSDFYEAEYRLRTKGGKWKWIYDKGKVVERGFNNNVTRVTGVINDITDRKEAEKLILYSEKRYRELFDNMSNGVVVFKLSENNTEFVWHDLNKSAERILKVSKQKVIGKSLNATHPTINEYIILDTLMNVSKTGIPVHIPDYYISGKNLEGWYESFMYKLPGGEIVAVIDDISERKKAVEELVESENRYSSIFKENNAVMFLLDPNTGKIFDANNAAAEFYGYTTEEIIGKNISEINILSPEEIKEEMQNARNRSSNYFLFQHKLSNGSIRDVEVYSAPIIIKKKAILFSIVHDITERKEAEEALKYSEERFRSLIQSMSDIVYTVSTDLMITGCFGHWVEQWGFYAPYLVGNPLSALFGKDSIKEHIEPHKKALKGEYVSYQWKRNVKGRKVYQTSLSPIYGDDNKLHSIVAVGHDITEQISIQQKLELNKNTLMNLTNHLQTVREEERAAISREIHDDLGQALTALKIDLSWIKEEFCTENNALDNRIEKMLHLTDHTLKTVKRISSELRPGILDELGLASAIEWQTDEFAERTKIECSLRFTPEEITLPKNLSIAVFRIFQETLTNVARHAKATKVSINLELSSGLFTMEIKDNGIGIKQSDIENSKSLGLLGMRERVRPFDGNVTIAGEENKGTTVLLEIVMD